MKDFVKQNKSEIFNKMQDQVFKKKYFFRSLGAFLLQICLVIIFPEEEILIKMMMITVLIR